MDRCRSAARPADCRGIGAEGEITETKDLKYRVLPMTKRLLNALTTHRHLRGERVLYAEDGRPVSATRRHQMHCSRRTSSFVPS